MAATPEVVDHAPLLIYDGDCGFCTRSAMFFADHIGSAGSVAPSHSLDIDALGLTTDQVIAAAWFRSPSGALHRGHEAIAHALIHSGGAWSAIGRFLLAPGISPVAAFVYAQIARNRHRLPGGTAACEMP